MAIAAICWHAPSAAFTCRRFQATRLVQALSLTFGIEALIVLQDICGLSDRDAQDVALWAAAALLDAARHEAGSAEA